MDGSFRAFSFVDRITSLQRGASIRGQYAIPHEAKAFPVSLVAEAIGQLAAWAAMAAVDFSHRPVAGLAGRVELFSGVRPGQLLHLAAELESVDTDAVAYSGTAHADGMPAVRLVDCVGPMLPLADFDEPDAVRARFRSLRALGATAGGFHPLPPLALQRAEGEPGRRVRAFLPVASAAPLFSDHFPRRPVFPGTLLMHASLQTAAMLAAEVPSGNGAPWLLQVISNVKLRDFIPPGQTLTLQARLSTASTTLLSVVVESRIGERLIGSAGVQFSSESPS